MWGFFSLPLNQWEIFTVDKLDTQGVHNSILVLHGQSVGNTVDHLLICCSMVMAAWVLRLFLWGSIWHTLAVYCISVQASPLLEGCGVMQRRNLKCDGSLPNLVIWKGKNYHPSEGVEEPLPMQAKFLTTL